MAFKSPTEINWTKGAGEGMNYNNEVTNGLFSNMFLFSLYFIIVWGFYKTTDDIVGGLAVGGFSITLIGLIMWIGGWVTWVTFSVCCALMLIGAAAVILDSN